MAMTPSANSEPPTEQPPEGVVETDRETRARVEKFVERIGDQICLEAKDVLYQCGKPEAWEVPTSAGNVSLVPDLLIESTIDDMYINALQTGGSTIGVPDVPRMVHHAIRVVEGGEGITPLLSIDDPEFHVGVIRLLCYRLLHERKGVKDEHERLSREGLSSQERAAAYKTLRALRSGAVLPQLRERRRSLKGDEQQRKETIVNDDRSTVRDILRRFLKRRTKK